MKKILSCLLCIVLMVSFTACSNKKGEASLSDDMERLKSKYSNAQVLELSEEGAKLNGEALNEYDYTWKFDPDHQEPYYTGEKPSEGDGAYISHDIVYYPKVDESAFSKENYDGETEWVTHYTADKLTDYIFATLPVLGNDIPSQMMHTPKEAYKNPVIHITKAGEYIVSGKWDGQILIDLGEQEETFTNKDAKVTLILDNTDITCTVAPAIIFKNVYECDNEWESRSQYGNNVDLTDAGAKVVLADGSENNIKGANVYRILKPKYKDEKTKTQKKLYKTDGAFYSYVSMLIDGEEKDTGILNIESTTYEGLDSELHLTIDGGYINIVSKDDGINVNEDNVSVFTMNGGHLMIFAGQGAEGDVIDSNGYITVNGGFIAGTSPSVSDDMFDCDCEKKVSANATVVSNTSNVKGGGMPMGDKPDGNPPEAGTEPPDKKPDNNDKNLNGK